MLIALICMCGGLLLDWYLGEPRRAHPLVGFGRWAHWIEHRVYRNTRWAGVLAYALAVLPWVGLVGCASYLASYLATHCASPVGQVGYVLLALGSVYFALGHRSLHDHVRPIIQALQAGDEGQARAAVARIVSRDAAHLEIAPAACETILENGNDAVFGALFWFLCAGPTGVVLYRLANTLDAMWGYKNPRYLSFGWAAARLDDGLNWLPARLTALTYALLGHTAQAWRCWRQQGTHWKSPNAGPVMAAGAGALGIQLGGPACYQGVWQARPWLGAGAAPHPTDIERALKLVRHGVLIWALMAWLLYGLWHELSGYA